MSTSDRVREYYAAFGDREWQRLTNAADGAIEWAVTCRVLAVHLPPGARVLDLGGGPGRYSIWLAERGHRVVLADLSPQLLAIARTRIAEANVGDRVEAIVEADARDLGAWPDASFDAVLSLGPFYHLPAAADRARAAAELARVLRPGGVAFVAFMPRLSFVRRTIAIADERRHLRDAAWLRQLLVDGVFDNDVPGRFANGYGADPVEIAPFLARHGFEQRMLLATEGISAGLERTIAELAERDPASYQTVLDLLVDSAADPSILGMANHLLYVGHQRPTRRQ